jgi:hypothetical protein
MNMLCFIVNIDRQHVLDFLFRIEAFRPLWLTITDEIPGFKFLTDAFNSNEKTPQYCDAVSRALDIPTCKVVPFFGTFLKDLRTILSSVPSIVVLCNRNTQKPIEVCSIDKIRVMNENKNEYY